LGGYALNQAASWILEQGNQGKIAPIIGKSRDRTHDVELPLGLVARWFKEATMRRRVFSSLASVLFGLIAAYPQHPANAQGPLPLELQERINKVATDALAKSGVPSASIAVVKNGRLVYLHAYGNARLDPTTPAKPDMRYGIGSPVPV
jgi:hypothetical protein